MRITSISLSWFRGAADSITLQAGGKSAVVYGSNGSGKSSFVDAIEYIVTDGKISHLSHAYSGRRQERGVINTHTPVGQKTGICITFQDGTLHKIAIDRDGTSSCAQSSQHSPETWDYQRTVLRQQDVASFIVSTKGDKYSTLLPLLGLQPLETAAQNLRQLVPAIESVSKLSQLRGQIENAGMAIRMAFPATTKSQREAMLVEILKRYLPDVATDEESLRTALPDLKMAIQARTANSDAELRRHLALLDIASRPVRSEVSSVRTSLAAVAAATEPLVRERLQILDAANSYLLGLPDDDTMVCPACGTQVGKPEFAAHVEAERTRLNAISKLTSECRTSTELLLEKVTLLYDAISKEAAKNWLQLLDDESDGDLLKQIAFLAPQRLRQSCGENELSLIEAHLQPIVERAGLDSRDAPPEAVALASDLRMVSAAIEALTAEGLQARVARANSLMMDVQDREQRFRDEIRDRCQTIVSAISEDVQRMWGILHPDERITGIRVYMPSEADKAIDIGLVFHGIEQESPRLTLSEGKRNCLGLCIFLAMAKRAASDDRPLFLDDVVVSLDRSHRGMIAKLLKAEFSDRQVILLTHDRDWFADLKHQMPAAAWSFHSLIAFDSPRVGMRWVDTKSEFDAARALLERRPDAAANDARKIMDTSLAIAAEKLGVSLPFIRGERNDHRMAHEFVSRLAKDCKKQLLQKGAEKHVPIVDVANALAAADDLLLTWGNRGSHSSDVEKVEAEELINVCERAMDTFRCPKCKDNVWTARLSNGKGMLCTCGDRMWKLD